MQRVLSFVKPIIANFGPLITFLLAKAFFGLTVAIATTVAVTLAEVIWRLSHRERPSGFFWFTVAITVVFGGVDLWLGKSAFFRYEAVATNLLSAIWFGATTFGHKPVILEIAERGRSFERAPRVDIVFFFRLLTWVWVVYFVIKAGVYLVLALRQGDLSRLVVLRALIGSVSFYLLLASNIFGGRRIFIWIRNNGWMPSQRSPASSPPQGRQAPP
ncbi:MAG: septation protein IspZ [Myxococcales bacterium]|nr:septation protein IspZ [Myxococcales bacterium]